MTSSPVTSIHLDSPAATLRESLAALLESTVLLPAAATGWIRVTGEDRVRWLNGMVTNSIQALTPGDGCFNLLLNAQGRIQGTAWAFSESGETEVNALLLQTDRAQLAPLLTLLDRFIIMDDVELTDLSSDPHFHAGLILAGPRASESLANLGLPSPVTPAPHLIHHLWHDAPVLLITRPGRLFPTWELWSDPATLATLTRVLTEAGAISAEPTLLESMRLLEGIPRFGTDIRDRDLPQEIGLPEALHFNKGCYVGQEIVERIRSRGSVHRTFTGFRLEGPLPAPGSPLEAAGKPVGELTSLAFFPSIPGYPDGLHLALGYIRREALDSGQPLTCQGAPVHPLSMPVSLAAPAHPTPDVR